MMQAEKVANRRRFAQWLRSELRKKGWSPAQLAIIHLGMRDPSLVQRWLAEKNMPSGETLMALEELFGSSPTGKRLTLRKAQLSEALRPAA